MISELKSPFNRLRREADGDGWRNRERKKRKKRKLSGHVTISPLVYDSADPSSELLVQEPNSRLHTACQIRALRSDPKLFGSGTTSGHSKPPSHNISINTTVASDVFSNIQLTRTLRSRGEAKSRNRQSSILDLVIKDLGIYVSSLSSLSVMLTLLLLLLLRWSQGQPRA